MSFLSRLVSSKQTEEEDVERKSIAIVGLDGAGKTTIVKRILKSDFQLSRPTFGVNIEIYRYRTVEFVVYDLGGQSPLRKSLWEKFVASADGLVFVLDSADTERFDIAKQEFNNALSYNQEAPVLFLSNKIDLEDAASANVVLDLIDFNKLSRLQRKYHFARCSALTGEALFESWDWLSLQLCKNQDLKSNNITILGGLVYHADGLQIEDFLFGKPKTQFIHNKILKKAHAQTQKFIKKMEQYPRAETMLFIENKQQIVVKDENVVVGLIIENNDLGTKALQISKFMIDKMQDKELSDFDFKQLLFDHYPLDVLKETK
ncbi:MAG: Arf family protein [Asgard group archaeon]|nr:Arf family protein [Asgard group archaeon]